MEFQFDLVSFILGVAAATAGLVFARVLGYFFGTVSGSIGYGRWRPALYPAAMISNLELCQSSADDMAKARGRMMSGS